MKFLEQPQLEMLTSFLSSREMGDRVLNGRIEAFSCKRAGEDKKMAKILEQQYVDELATSPQSLGVSPLGPLSSSSTRRLLIDLISTMNASFPDHDFSVLRPEQFVREHDMNTVMATVNNYLAPLRETYNSTFLEELWLAMESVVRLHECEVYSYIPDMEEDPFSEGNLWSFNYFFFNRSLKRILYFTCIATSKYSLKALRGGAAMDSDMESVGDGEDDGIMGEWEDDA